MELVTRREAASMLGVSENTISNYAKRGILVSTSKFGKIQSITKESVYNLLKQMPEIRSCNEAVGQLKSEIEEQERSARERIDELNRLSENIRERYAILEGVRTAMETIECLFRFVLSKDEYNIQCDIRERDVEIVLKILKGKSSKHLSEEYFISSTRIQHIYEKLIHHVSSVNFIARIIEEDKQLRTRLQDMQTELNSLRMRMEGTSEVSQNRRTKLIYSKPQDVLELSKRSLNCLYKSRNRIVTVSDLVMFTIKGLRKMPAFGISTIRDIEKALEQHSLHLGMSLDEIEQYIKEGRCNEPT